MLAVEYLIDYHMGHSHKKRDLFKGCMIPNFLCGAILRTGLGKITDANLPSGLKPGDRLAFAKTILFLKFRSLRESDDTTDDKIRALKKNIASAVLSYYQEFQPLTIDIESEIIKTIGEIDSDYYKMVKNAIYSDFIRKDGEKSNCDHD